MLLRLLYTLALAGLAACASSSSTTESDDYIQFDPAWIDDYSLTDAELMQLQYYIGDQIELSRTVSSDFTSRGVENHRLVLRDGRATEVITFPRHTMCVLREIDREDPNRPLWSMQFEEIKGNSAPYLTFRDRDDLVGYGRIYTEEDDLRAEYLGQVYDFTIGEETTLNYTELLIGRDALKKRELDARRVRGLAVDEVTGK